MSELDRVLERVRQFRAARARELAAGAVKPVSPEERLGATFQPGARVFDRVSGQEGHVIGGTTETIIVPAAERQKS